MLFGVNFAPPPEHLMRTTKTKENDRDVLIIIFTVLFMIFLIWLPLMFYWDWGFSNANAIIKTGSGVPKNAKVVLEYPMSSYVLTCIGFLLLCPFVGLATLFATAWVLLEKTWLRRAARAFCLITLALGAGYLLLYAIFGETLLYTGKSDIDALTLAKRIDEAHIPIFRVTVVWSHELMTHNQFFEAAKTEIPGLSRDTWLQLEWVYKMLASVQEVDVIKKCDGFASSGMPAEEAKVKAEALMKAYKEFKWIASELVKNRENILSGKYDTELENAFIRRLLHVVARLRPFYFYKPTISLEGPSSWIGKVIFWIFGW